MAAGKEVAKRPANTSLLPDELAAAAAALGQVGLEDMTQSDRTTPFIGLIQGLSPEIDPSKPKYIEGATVGDIFNTVTREVYKSRDGGIRVVPVVFQKLWTVWVPREAGGGFLGSYADAELTKPIFVPGQAASYDGPTQVVETAQHWCLVEGKDGAWAPAVISMKSTQLTTSRNWCTLMTLTSQKYNAPVFFRVYRLTSVSKQNEKGTFYNYKVEDDGFSSLELVKLATDFRAMVRGGLVQADYTKSSEDAADAADEAPKAKRPGF